jgi:hypothetical protein
MFAPARQLDPLRMVQGTRNHRYDCPDLATLDRHITRLRHRVTTVGSRSPTVAAACRADIDRLLDRRAWLTLADGPTSSSCVQRADDRAAPQRAASSDKPAASPPHAASTSELMKAS